ncbi:MAG: histidine phosphatase family protein [Candidatus Velthaea sp.]
MQVYIARHGETTWNVAGRYQGRMESELSILGVRQGMALATACAALEPPLERVVSSPLTRCIATARFVGERLQLSVERDERLLEIAHGTWEGRLRDDIIANDGARYRAWKELPAEVAFPGGETLADVRARWRAFAAAFDAAVPALIVTHDVVVRIAILEAQGRGLEDLWNVRVQNGAYAIFEVDGARWTLVREIAAEHLAGLEARIETQAL